MAGMFDMVTDPIVVETVSLGAGDQAAFAAGTAC
jgi:hypothetical protein